MLDYELKIKGSYPSTTFIHNGVLRIFHPPGMSLSQRGTGSLRMMKKRKVKKSI